MHYECKNTEEEIKDLEYVLIRTYSAGVHVGYLKERNGQEVTLINSRRIWKWDGAATLSQIAMEGCKNPPECKISMCVDKIILTQAIEIISTTKRCKDFLDNVEEWKV